MFAISSSSSLFPLIRARLSPVHFPLFDRISLIPGKESIWKLASASCLQSDVEGLTSEKGLCCFLIIKDHRCPQNSFPNQHGINRLWMIRCRFWEENQWEKKGDHMRRITLSAYGRCGGGRISLWCPSHRGCWKLLGRWGGGINWRGGMQEMPVNAYA